jgi:hypothetical protein
VVKWVPGKGVVYDAENEESKAAHEWYNGITNAVRQADGSYEAESQAAASHIYRRPATATT